MTEAQTQEEAAPFALPDLNTFEKQDSRGYDFLDYGCYGKVHFRVVKLKRSEPGKQPALHVDAIVISSPNHKPGSMIGFYMAIGPHRSRGVEERRNRFMINFARAIFNNNDPSFPIGKSLETLIGEGRLSDEMSENFQAVWERKQGRAMSYEGNRKYEEGPDGKPVEVTGHYDDDSILQRP